MARGWESKSVADQQDEAAALPAQDETLYDADPAVRERHARLHALRLSHSRTVEQLQRATNPAHRRMLKRALLALEREMAELA